MIVNPSSIYINYLSRNYATTNIILVFKIAREFSLAFKIGLMGIHIQYGRGTDEGLFKKILQQCRLEQTES